VKIPKSAVKVYRTATLEVARHTLRAEGSGGDELLELEFGFASETPVERYFGFEELEISSKAARLDRVTQGVCPLLDNHAGGAVVGRVLSVTIGADRIARARVRFSRSTAARDVVQDVLDGIRQGVSFGYRVHEMILIESGDGGDRYRVTDWELFEITIASMPADPTIGVHRSADEQAFSSLLSQAHRGRKETKMTLSFNELADLNDDEFTELVTGWPKAKRAAAIEDRRRNHLETMARAYKVSDSLRDRAIREGWDANSMKFTDAIRAERANEPLSPPPTDMDRGYGPRDPVFSVDGQDMRAASLSRVISAHVTGRPQDAGESLELFDHFAKVSGRSPQGRGGFSIPSDLLARLAYPRGIQTRAVGKGIDGALGAALVPLEHEAAMFEEALRARTVSGRMGVRILAGLRGDSALPIALSDPTETWVGEGAGSGSSSPEFAAGVLSPHTVRVRVDITRRMLLQSVPMVDQIIAAAILARIGIAIETAIFAGAGGGTIPEGVLNTSGIGSPPYTSTSGATEYGSFVAAMTMIADADADLGSLGFVLTTGVRGRLQGKLLDPGSGRFVWEPGPDSMMGSIAGYRAGVTNTLPRNLGGGTNEHAILVGDWSQVVVGLWSGVDLMPDEVTLGDSGGVVLRAFQDADVLVRRPEAFAAMQVNPAA
jgi:HK97 family phage major capsid protein